MALGWTDVDLKKNVVNVERSWDPDVGVGLSDLLAHRRLALRVAGDAVVLGDGEHDVRDEIAEALADLLVVHLGLLDDVVEHAGRDHVVRVAHAVEQHRDLDRVRDERRAVGVAALAVAQRAS